ncbi:24890_t:CDS:2 [Dentiscutata erythropus]|uniref:24890_t:CDS:1 n=1 Tax=Dentiscutata erythropus TaxID=1348616 RepID=A0A9N9DY46_9GLOM|nr:24890_t:CDS:2 [Dentiscutata erythropus]
MCLTPRCADKCVNCTVDKQACIYVGEPGNLRCVRCKELKKWCCFRCIKCERKKEKRESFRPCELCVMTIIDPTEKYTIHRVEKYYLQCSNDCKIEITPDFAQNIISNSNQQSITFASTPVCSVGSVSLPSPSQQYEPTTPTFSNYEFSNTFPFNSITETSFCNPSEYGAIHAGLVNDNSPNNSHYAITPLRYEQSQPNAQDNTFVSTISNYNLLPSSYGSDY